MGYEHAAARGSTHARPLLPPLSGDDVAVHGLVLLGVALLVGASWWWPLAMLGLALFGNGVLLRHLQVHDSPRPVPASTFGTDTSSARPERVTRTRVLAPPAAARPGSVMVSQPVRRAA